MARRKSKKTPKQPQIGNLKASVVVMNKENPFFQKAYAESHTNPKEIKAFVNENESAVETLFSRGSIDLAHKMAADKFRHLWETCGGKGASAIDYSREYVDGGGAIEPISDRQLDAAQKLKECKNWLGDDGYHLVTKIAGQGYSLTQIYKDKTQRIYASEHFKKCVDLLAVRWKYANKRKFEIST